MTLEPLIHNLNEKPLSCSFELDPSKVGPNEKIEDNADRLQHVCQALLDMICQSTSRMPM
jgi:neurofibromin 1